jgi:hypothetical protein
MEIIEKYSTKNCYGNNDLLQEIIDGLRKQCFLKLKTHYDASLYDT